LNEQAARLYKRAMRVTATTLMLAVSLSASPAEAKSRPPKPPKREATVSPDIPPSTWRAMQDASIEVKLRDGRTVRGRLAGSDDKTATVVAADGEVVSVALKDATELREVAPPAPPAPAAPPPPPPTLDTKDAPRVQELEQRYGARYTKPKGKAMHNAGSALVALGITQLIISGGLGIATLALDGDEVLAAPGIGLLISGLVTVAVGGPLMGKGKRRRVAYYDWLHQQSLRDQARVTPGALTLRGGGGLSLRVAF
jgi:small nuclear ribonucleoprotein (snRNP)-like protein